MREFDPTLVDPLSNRLEDYILNLNQPVSMDIKMGYTDFDEKERKGVVLTLLDPETNKPLEKGQVNIGIDYGDYRPPDQWMEWVLWTMYLSGFGWILGYVVYIPVGFFAIMIWIQWWDWVGFFQFLLDGTDGVVYATGPMRRFQVGFVIWMIGMFTFWIPGLNFIMAPLLGYWAVMDYYDYKY